MRGGGAGEQLRAQVGVYERAMDRYEPILADMARLGPDERLVRVQQGQAALMTSIFLGALADPGLGEEIQQADRQALAARIRLRMACLRRPLPLAAHGDHIGGGDMPQVDVRSRERDVAELLLDHVDGNALGNWR
jgi:hypothetical protein